MSDLEKAFAQAAADAKTLPVRPGNLTLLRLYALYKQGSNGDADDERPSDFVGGAKWDAWHALAGMSRDEAMQAYVDLVESLK